MYPLLSRPRGQALCESCRFPATFHLRARGTFCSLRCLEQRRGRISPLDRPHLDEWISTSYPTRNPPLLSPIPAHFPSVLVVSRHEHCRRCRYPAVYRIIGRGSYCSAHCLSAAGTRPYELEALNQWYARRRERHRRKLEKLEQQRKDRQTKRLADRGQPLDDQSPVVRLGGATVALTRSEHGEQRPVRLASPDDMRILPRQWAIETVSDADVQAAEDARDKRRAAEAAPPAPTWWRW